MARSWRLSKIKGETDESLQDRIAARMFGKEMPDPVIEEGAIEGKPRRWWLTLIWTWQADLVSILVALVFRVLWGRDLFWADGIWAELKEHSWPARTWYKRWNGTTLCHGGFISFGKHKCIPHELHHVEQCEARMLAGFIIGLASAAVTLFFDRNPWHALIALELPWFGVWPLGYLASLAQAYLRGEDPYYGSHLEEAAYALEDD